MRVNKGFTLVELLVVIAIIGVLSTLVMANFIGIRQRARDAQRKADLRQIQSALEIYRADIGSYKTTAVGTYYLNTSVCPGSSSFVSGNNTYMQSVPCDPSGSGVYNGGNYYYYSNNGTTYTLAACIENTGDSDSHVSQTAPNPAPPSNSTCSSGYYYILQNP